MESIWLLQHVHDFADGSEDVKIIGAFASREEGEAAQASIASQPGFREIPQGFSLNEVRLGVVAWTEGFLTVSPLSVGKFVRIESVDSCARELPAEDQERLYSLVGQEREIIEIDSYGFVWLSFSPKEKTADFCLFPKEVAPTNENDI